MANTQTAAAYTIHKGSDGGYVVRSFCDHSFAPPVDFASSTIDEALSYIRRKMEPARAE